MTTTTTVADEIADTYVRAAGGDADAALREVVRDALADLIEAERGTMPRNRLISRGFGRRALVEAGVSATSSR